MKTICIVLALTFGGLGTAYAEPKPFEEMRNSLEAVGQNIADFQACDGDWKAVQDAGFRLVKKCSIGTKEQMRMRTYINRSTDAREADIDRLGGSCKGNLSARRDVVIAAIEQVIAECER